MQRDEHIRLFTAGKFNPVAQFVISVITARQHRLDPPRGIKLARQFPCCDQRNILFLNTRRADGARVLAAMSGIDKDNPLAPWRSIIAAAISGHSLGFGEWQQQAINTLRRRWCGGLWLWLKHGNLSRIGNTFIEDRGRRAESNARDAS